MPITKLKCPTCKGPAVSVSERTIAGMRMVTYKCGHADVQKQLTRTDFVDFVSSDGKRPYPFQIDGALFGIDSNANCMIMDEMGLGKTVQSLMIIKSHEKELCKFLVLCKSGLKVQWSKEIPRWCGEDWFAQIIDSEGDFLLPGVKGYILSFDMLWRFKDIEGFIKRAKIRTVVMDEVQHIKNSGSKRTNGVREVCKLLDHRIALSGTPVKNHAGEFFPILNILRPDRFRTKSEYDQIWVDTYWNGRALKYGGLKDAEKFKRYTADFIIRRTREEVMPDLPVISREYRFSELGPAVEAAYKDTFKQFQDYFNYGGSDDAAFVRQSNILAYLSKMRHLAGIAKVEPAVAFLEDFVTETDRKIVVFLHHKDVAKLMQGKLADLQQADPALWGSEILSLSADLDSAGRQSVVERFADSNHRIMIASTLASGEGLNLQFCADCLVIERQWNPANEEQAEARFIRIGQLATSVTATYLVAVGTVDEFFSKLVEKKRAFCANAVDGKDYAWEESSLVQELAEVLAQSGGKQWGW